MINVKIGGKWCVVFCIVVKMYDYVYIDRIVGVKFGFGVVSFVVGGIGFV